MLREEDRLRARGKRGKQRNKKEDNELEMRLVWMWSQER
jgi:hypothetical protein